jgi:signal transduction histidine kinase
MRERSVLAGADGYLEKRELLGLDPRKIVLMILNLVERNRLRRQAEETNRRQAELLSVLSHDVRAPFQTLLGTIELLKKNPDHDATRNIETLYQCAKDQLAFINSLLEFLRLESGMAGFRRSPVDVNLPVNSHFKGWAAWCRKEIFSIASSNRVCQR